MAKNNTANEPPSKVQEIIAIIGVFISLFFFISLLSYTPSTPDALTASSNWGGSIGAFTAQVLLGMFGISAYLLIFLITLFAVKFYFYQFPLKNLPVVLFGITGIMISSSSLSAQIPFTLLSTTSGSAAGVIGENIHSLLLPFLGRVGYALVFIFILVMCLIASLEFSPFKFFAMISRVVSNLIRRLSAPRSQEQSSVAVVTPKNRLVQSPTQSPLIITPKLNEPVKFDISDDDVAFQPLLPVAKGDFVLPTVTLLDMPLDQTSGKFDREHYLEISEKLESKFKDFGIDGKVIGISPGPIVTTYEYSPAPGVKISRIVSLENDLALGLKTESVRIAGSIPGKAALGIEIPNPIRQLVYFREILSNEKFLKSKSALTLGLGKDVVGNPVFANLADMPHLLIAGATGAGKSVGINTIICSFLLKASPDEVRLLMIDPKRIELSHYEDIPHLLHPVVVDPKMASRALQWAVLEMERRYKLMEEQRVKNLASYNKVADIKIPLIVIIIDELADLMMVASKDVEGSVARLAQMARAAGMHLILATQRPSVDVLTGLIKANFPTRMSFKVSSKIDSRTILDESGAEHLLGKGDMLFTAPGTSRMQRIHGAYISEKEIDRVVSFLKKQRAVQYDETVMKIAEEPGDVANGQEGDLDFDEKYDEAVEFVCESGQASISMVQRRLRVGYNRAARMIETMEKEGIVGPADGAKPREVLTRKSY
nr:DNA translocase FtsK 4TM domain-containing protein [Desulfobulbaceae bacterium]